MNTKNLNSWSIYLYFQIMHIIFQLEIRISIIGYKKKCLNNIKLKSDNSIGIAFNALKT